ncbi:MAG TPA: F0F1 ATP synthase subunit gamma [Propionibacteriaceae bacterium]|nr:F0F1 ATP synthase subunit gamma [Propionibacteriaceae bacterium]
MKRRTELMRRLRSVRTLRSAVSAMKSISARHFRETRREIDPSDRYREEVERISAWSGVRLAGGDGEAGLVLIGGELGLCGAYNSRVVAAALARREELGPGPTLCVGHRSATMLGRRGVRAAEVYATPTSVAGITRVLLPLAEAIVDRSVDQRLRSLDIVSSRFVGVGSYVVESVRLLPASAPVAADAPTIRYASGDDMAAAAARELLYIRLYDLLLDAMACEHSARLVASQSAERWLDERTEQLARQLAGERREASTQEVLEIATSARARGRRGAPARERRR